MRKLNLLIGAVTGLFGGLLLGNKKLRQELKGTKDPKVAAKILGKELQRGGKEVAKEAKQWYESPETQRGLKRFKHYLLRQWRGVEKKAGHVAQEATDVAKKKANEAYDRAKEYAANKW